MCYLLVPRHSSGSSPVHRPLLPSHHILAFIPEALLMDLRGSTHLGGPAEQEPAWVEAIHTALGTVAIVHVAGPGHRPLAVVE